jgi:hypothetical protein
VDWARGILSPDLLALLDDAELPFDLEIGEGWLFLYSPRQLAGETRACGGAPWEWWRRSTTRWRRPTAVTAAGVTARA